MSRTIHPSDETGSGGVQSVDGRQPVQISPAYHWKRGSGLVLRGRLFPLHEMI